MKNVELSEKAKEKLKRLPPMSKYAVMYLIDCVENLLDMKCNEALLSSTIDNIQQNAKGKVGKDDVLNYDKAGKLLGISSRNNLKSLLDKNGIKQVKINNMNCGFLKSEILALKEKMSR